MSKLIYTKHCEGCGKMFRRNRNRKRHIAGYTRYKCVYDKDGDVIYNLDGTKQKEVVEVRPPCPKVGDNYRAELLGHYTLTPWRDEFADMKIIQSIVDGELKKVTEEQAQMLTKHGWKYVPKKVWKMHKRELNETHNTKAA